MKRYVRILIPCLLSIFLVSCTTTKKNIEIKQIKPAEEWEYGKLVFMADECVAWFTSDLTVIGPGDMGEYFRKNNIEPVENKILAHFASLGWEVVEETKKDKYTIEYKMRREKMKSYVSE